MSLVIAHCKNLSRFAQSNIHQVEPSRSVESSAKMLLKTVAYFLFIHTTNGCCDIDDLEHFDTVDLDGNGFVSRDELFINITNDDVNATEFMEKEWESFNFVSDEGIKCQGKSSERR